MSKAVIGRANASIKSEIYQVTEGKEIGAHIKHTGIEKQASLLPVFDLSWGYLNPCPDIFKR